MKCNNEVLKQAEFSMPVLFPFYTECMKYCRSCSLYKHISPLSYIIQNFQFPDGVDYLTPYTEIQSANPAPVLYCCSTLLHCIIDITLPLATTYVLSISFILILFKCLSAKTWICSTCNNLEFTEQLHCG